MQHKLIVSNFPDDLFEVNRYCSISINSALEIDSQTQGVCSVNVVSQTVIVYNNEIESILTLKATKDDFGLLFMPKNVHEIIETNQFISPRSAGLY